LYPTEEYTFGLDTYVIEVAGCSGLTAFETTGRIYKLLALKQRHEKGKMIYCIDMILIIK